MTSVTTWIPFTVESRGNCLLYHRDGEDYQGEEERIGIQLQDYDDRGRCREMA